MKQKIFLFIILSGLAGLIFSLKEGIFTSSQDGYVNTKMPNIVDYNFHIKPILTDNCYTCHGPDANKRKAGLRLDIEEGAFSELSESPGEFPIIAGKPNKSSLYQHIISDDPAALMPPSDSKLTLDSYEKKLIKKWIKQGGKYEKHWAFLAPEKSPLPTNIKKEWPQNEIDAFILEKIEEKGLFPSPKADTEILIRRISLDLTGLPPKQEIVQKLVTNPTDELFEKVIDEFLASKAYGERMTQTWLDLARYADSHGYQDDSYRTMWPWRDWVIHAFNKNMPYDDFLTWQLAGDLLPNATKEQILATGFNRNHPITQEDGIIQEEYRTNYVLDRTNTLGKGILGMTMECARCHDHKYDPISQKDYFGLFSFFNNVDEKGLQLPANMAAEIKLFADPPFMVITDKETKNLLSFVNLQGKEEIKVMVMNDSAPRDTFVLNRGNYDEPTDTVWASAPPAIYPFSEDYPKNRLGLAKWVTNKNNPLTSRVFVNRIWGMIFGRGIVETTEDFGAQGSLPTHPELLDWLAVDFIEHDWDIKYLLKKIMLSATYQQSAVLEPELKKVDPENRLLARAPRFRMSGEMIRDYILTSSGLLNTEIGGASVRPYQPPGLWEETTAGKHRGILTKYVVDEGDNIYRRSLYTIWKRTLPPPSMTIFDAPSRDFCEVRRQKTNTPLQALALQNDVQVLEAARVLAQNTVSIKESTTDMVNEVFQKILVRKPKIGELQLLESYYAKTWEELNKKKENADKLLAQGNYEKSNTDPIKTAALMLTAQVIYNLDETITKE